MLEINIFKNPIGLDISDFKVRFIQLAQKPKNKSIITALGEINMPNGYVVGGEIINEAGVSQLIKNVIQNPKFGKIQKNYINASLPEKKIFLKKISIPSVPENELKGAISWAVEQNIPLSLDQVFFDWQILPFTSSGKKSDKINALISVAPKNIVDSYTRVIINAGLTPIGLENESVAIARCLIDQYSDINYPLSILDLGRSRTSIIIYQNNIVQYSAAIDVSGEEMTQAISKAINLSWHDSEKAKLIYGLDQKRGRGAIKKIVQPIIDRLLTNANDNFEYFNTYISTDTKFNTIIITGSVSSMLGLQKYMQDKLSKTIILGDPLTNLSQNSIQNQNNNYNLHSFATAVGLALKKFE